MGTKRVLTVLVLAATVAAGCGRVAGDGGGVGSGGGDEGIGYATGATDLVLSVTVAGGFVMPSYALATLPSFALYGDGTVITMGPQIMIYPPPALPPLLAQRLTGSGIQKVLEAAQEAGVFEDAAYTDFCGVADVGTTTIVSNVEGIHHEVSAYALGMDGCMDDPAARAALLAFVGKVTDLSWLESEMDTVGPVGPYAFTSAALIVGPAQPSPDLPQEEVAWPLATPLAAFGAPYEGLDLSCGVVSDAEVETLRPLFEQANELTPFTSDGAAYTIRVRPLLPDETSCPSLDGGGAVEPMR